ncbi:unnamed protein product, partial [Laminaria digitata]
TQSLGRLCARALQLHPRNAGLWIKAASWEFFDGGNASSARALMQRGLRINPTARNLWLQYFRLEFSYIKKLMGRREVLGLDGGGGGAGGGGGRGGGGLGQQREGMDIPLLEGEGEGGQPNAEPSFKAVQKATAEEEAAAGDTGDGARSSPVMNATARSFYKGSVPLAVFRAAVKAVPEDVEFRAGFLRCCAVDFPHVGREAAEAILGSIARDFPESCEAWEVRASYPLLVAEGGGAIVATAATGGGRVASMGVGGGLGPVMQECIGTFELAVEAIGSREPAMWVRYASFLKRRLESESVGQGEGREGDLGGKKRKGRGGGGPPAPVAAALVQLLQQVLARAVETHLSVSSAASKAGVGVAAGGGTGTAVGAEGGDRAAMESLASEDAEDAREALSAGLADVLLAMGKPDSALEALRAATASLAGRAGPWLNRAALERRLHALGGSQAMTAEPVGGGSTPSRLGSAAPDGDGFGLAVETLRSGIKSVSATSPGYPTLWRELLAALVAVGAGKKAVAVAFREAAEACDPSGSADQGVAQGEFLAGYLRWSVTVGGGIEAARRAFQWARRSFLLAGTGAAAVYREAIELEMALGWTGGKRGEERAKRVRVLFE